MGSRLRIITVASIAILAWAPLVFLRAGELKKQESKIREGAYYEFRGHISDRNTLEHTFTLGWAKGSQQIRVTADTKIFRKGRAARLEDAKAGDAVRGVGQAKNGRLIAVAVAFGDDGVELPSSVKMPDSITLPPNTGD